MDELDSAIRDVRRADFANRSVDDLIEEHHARIWHGSDTDENRDRIEALGNEIQARRGSLSQRVDQLERKVADQQGILIVLGIWAIGGLFINHYGKEAVEAWLPVALGVWFIWAVYRSARRYIRTRKYRQ